MKELTSRFTGHIRADPVAASRNDWCIAPCGDGLAHNRNRQPALPQIFNVRPAVRNHDQLKQALKDAAIAVENILNIHCKVVVSLIICLLTSLPAQARYPPHDATSIVRSWSANLTEIRGIIYLEGPASFGIFNANCMIDGPRNAMTAQVAANVHHLIGWDMRFLFLIDPITVGQK